jgi:hypothetical protein
MGAGKVGAGRRKFTVCAVVITRAPGRRVTACAVYSVEHKVNFQVSLENGHGSELSGLTKGRGERPSHN